MKKEKVVYNLNPFKKLSYKKNYYSKDIVKPLVFLCNKNLTRIGRLNPVNDLNISVNYNAADEISLSIPKYIQDMKVPFYDEIQDLSVIETKNGFDDNESRYFEIGMDEKDTGAIVKSATGQELGYAELSQKLVTLEINTDADIALDDYVPTVLYNSDNKRGSLLDRLLSYAPDYEVGHVDDTVAGLQRTFSWSDAYMDACLNDICEELECIYTITVRLDENDKVIKRINIYDICYCKDCWNDMINNKSTDMAKGDYWKNVLNGVCQTCKGTNVYDVGVDTPILLNTKNFSDDISVQVDKDSIKNCFKLKAGDDTLTNIVEGVLATSTNKIMMFSEDQTSKMSDELREQWEAYYNKVNNTNTIKEYDKLTNLKYDIYDLIEFIRSSKMPTVDTDQGGLDDAYYDLIHGLQNYDYTFYTPSSSKISKASSGTNAVKSLVSLYIGNGYSFSVDGDATFNATSPDINDEYYVWKGSVKVYKTDDKDTYFIITVDGNGTFKGRRYYGKDGNEVGETENGVNFKIYYSNKNIENYKKYLDQQIKNTLHDNDVTEYDERDWSKYSIERLKSFYDGYEECLTMLDKMELTIEEEVGKTTADLLSSQKSVITELRKKYQAYVVDIAKIKAILEDQVFSLYYCLDSEQLAEQYPPLNNSQDYNYVLQVFTTIQGAVSSLITGKETILYTYDSDGNMTGTQKVKIGSLSSPNRGVQCSNCGSTNLQYDRATQKYTCVNKGCNAGSTKVVTYYNYAQDIVEWFTDNFGRNVYFLDIEDNIRKIQSDLYIRNNFTDENYKELCSFIREDVYENSNYTSDNIVDNTRLLETARKFVDRAKQQLAIACVPQISITATVSSLLVQSEIPNEELFDDFAIGNYIRVSIDDTVYKLRIIGIKYDFENLEKVEVTFSNVTKSLFGAMSDIQSILQQASSMATSFSSVAKQAENGQSAARKFEHIKKEGLDSSLGTVKAAKNQEIVVDDHGILCRYYNKWLNQYDDRQLKIINQNIVMTDDGWENAKLAIGLGQYNGEAKWGVWADMLVGDLMITKDLKVVNDGATVEINGDGITLDGGAITWKNNKLGTDAISGLDDDLSDLNDKITKGDKANSDALVAYQKEIKKFQDAVNGSLGVTTITSDSVISPKIGGGYLYISKDKCSVEIDPSQKYVANNSNVIKVTANGSDVFHITRTGDGYFKGQISATSLTLDKEVSISTSNISGLADVATSGNYDDLTSRPDLDVYEKSVDVDAKLKEYATTGSLDAYLKTNDLGTKLDGLKVSYRGDVKTTQVVDKTTGLITTTSSYIGSDGKTYTNKTYTYPDADYVLLNRENKWGTGSIAGDGKNLVKISKDGLLTANNAVIYGTIYATDGEFTGKITATSGDIGNWKIKSLTDGNIGGWLYSDGYWETYDNGYTKTDAGIQWILKGKNNNNQVYSMNMNGMNFDMGYSSNGSTPIPKIRLNTCGNSTNSLEANCVFADVGYIYLKSAGNIDLRADSAIKIDSNVILQRPTNDFICGYNAEKTLLFKIAGLTYWADGGHTTDFGNTLIGTNIYGTQIHLRADNGIYQGDSTIITSDKRTKKDITFFDDRYEKFFMNINPSIYKFIDGTSNRFHSGFISQEIEKALIDNDLTTKDFAGFIKYNDIESNEEKYALRYEEFIALNTHMIQKLYKRIDELEKLIKKE